MFLMLYMQERHDEHVSYGVINGDWETVKIGETTESVRRMEISQAGDLWLLLWSSGVKVYECTGAKEAGDVKSDYGNTDEVNGTGGYCWAVN
jgi:hypothetical protein